MALGPCMCGSLSCWSCGPAQNAPSCYYSKYRCGDPECSCATSPNHQEPEKFDEYDSYEDELEAEEEYDALR